MASNRLRKSEVDDFEETRQPSLPVENAIFAAITANDSKALASILSSDPTAVESVNSYVIIIYLKFISFLYNAFSSNKRLFLPPPDRVILNS